MVACHWCNEGLVINNHCGNCGATPNAWEEALKDKPALVLGGQGHTNRDIRNSSTILAILLLVGAVTGLIVLTVWLCGRI